MQKVIAKINLKALCDNARTFRQLTGVPLYAVVKADAYGHGGVEITKALLGQVDGFAVALVEEGLPISTIACGKEILVFTPPTTEQECLLMIKGGLTPSVTSLKTANLIVGVCQKYHLQANVHLKCNTGMNRYGMGLPALGKACKVLLKKGVTVTGLYSHLYAHERETAEKQRQRFLSAQAVCKKYFPKVKCHLSATYGALLGKDFSFDAVRIGIGLYGYLPDDVDETKLPLQKVMSVYAKCLDERTYDCGGVGYATNPLLKGEKLRTIRYGYADGQPYNGCAKIGLSNPCMDVSVCQGDDRRLCGKWTAVMTDARQVALQDNTISYEILCRAAARAERIYGYD